MAGEEEPPRDSHFNCLNRAKGGVWYKWQEKKNHPLTQLDSFKFKFKFKFNNTLSC